MTVIWKNIFWAKSRATQINECQLLEMQLHNIPSYQNKIHVLPWEFTSHGLLSYFIKPKGSCKPCLKLETGGHPIIIGQQVGVIASNLQFWITPLTFIFPQENYMELSSTKKSSYYKRHFWITLRWSKNQCEWCLQQ